MLGAINLHSKWKVYALTLGEWTLDYPAYDPEWEPTSDEDTMSFRNGLMCVDENNAHKFCNAMQDYEIPFDILQSWIEQHKVQLMMLIDFDTHRFVHGYSEPVEPTSNYIPKSWIGIVGKPLDYVSEEVRRLWLL